MDYCNACQTGMHVNKPCSIHAAKPARTERYYLCAVCGKETDCLCPDHPKADAWEMSRTVR